MNPLLRRVAAVVAVGIAAFGFGLAHASSAQADVYTVCGYGVTLPIPGGTTCMSLPDAITAAQASSGADTIRMLPGDYCPIDLEGNFYSPIKFVGVGIAGLDTSGGTIILDGPEASLTTFVYNEVFCGGATSAIVEVNGFVETGVPFTFENLTIDGSGGGSIGLYSPGGAANITLRDVIVENVTGSSGIQFTSGLLGSGQYSGLEIDNSAIIDNSNGVAALSGDDSIYDTTIAGNTGTGLSLANGYDSLGDDTIAHNGVGVAPPDFNLQVINTIVANNTENCSGTNDWEYPAADSWNNLLESANEGCHKLDTTDTVVPTITMPAVGLNGGPTPSIQTPLDAAGNGGTPCGLFGVDQREFIVSGTSCDVGSVQASADGTPDVGASPLALGYVDTGSATDASVEVESTGGDLVGVSDVSVSGTDWAIANDGCTYTLLVPAQNSSSCAVELTVTPTADGEHDGTLTVDTTAGTLTIALTSDAVTRATGRDDSYDVTGDSLVEAAPGVLGNDQDGASIDEVVTQPSDGTLTTNADGSFTYTPNVDFVGDDSFQYTVIADGLFESHPITVTLHVLGYTVSLDEPSYTVEPGGTFTVQATVTPVHGFTGDVCFDVADSNGSTWPSWLSPGTDFQSCEDEEDVASPNQVSLGGGQQVVTLPVDVAADATDGAYSLEILTSDTNDDAPTVVSQFQLAVGNVGPPAISSFRPANVGVGTTVTIVGSGLLDSTAVSFNGTPASGFTIVSDNEVTAVVAAGTSSGKISVTTPTGTATSANLYSFFAQPAITSLSPTSASVGSTVVVGGTSLNGATSVTLNGTQVPFDDVSSSEITFTVPAAAASGTVTVVTYGGSTTSSGSITVGPPPTITSFGPGTGPVGTSVTITGTNLDQTVGIEIGGIVTVPTSVDATEVVFSIPPGAVSGTIKLLAANGSVTSIDTFTVTG